MQQRGGDDEGILGFLPADINRELNRGKRLLCTFCKKKGATLGCVNKKCKRVFHLPCGLRNNTLHQFFDQFKSFCQTHRPKQHIDMNILKSTPERTTCWICFDSASRQDIYQTLWAPCCKKNAWFHRDCVQQLALSAGYFFKCPLCNNKKEFQSAMQECGIFVPSQDASWELVPNAFQELLYRHNRCDAPECKCPQGRDYNSATNSQWEMVLCRTCGSQGTHVTCGNLRWAKSWDCTDCLSILSKKFAESSSRLNGTVPHDENSENNNVSIDSDDEEDASFARTLDISSINLKPGPRSAKLKQLHKTAKNLPAPVPIEQLKSILDEQQAQSSEISQKSQEEEEISIVEVKTVPQRPAGQISPEKYPELSIGRSRKPPESSSLLATPGTSVQARNLPSSVEPEKSLPVNNLPEVPRNKVVEDVIVVDSDDEEQRAGTSQIESSCLTVEQPELIEEPQDCADGVLNIKITEVTSLAPEVFAQVPDNSTNVTFEEPTIESSNFGTENNFSKRKADSPSVLSTLVDRVNNVIDTNAKELMRASLPTKKPRITSGTSGKTVVTSSSTGSSFVRGMTRIVPPSYNLLPNNPPAYNRSKTAIVKVYDKQFLVPIGQERSIGLIGSTGSAGSTGSVAPISSVGSTGSIGPISSVVPIGSISSVGSIGSAGSTGSIGLISSVGPIGSISSIGSVGSISSTSSEQPEQVPSDGDAGSEPASEFTLPPTTPAATTSATCWSVPAAHSPPPPPPPSPPAATTSAACQTELFAASTSALQSGTVPGTQTSFGLPGLPNCSGHPEFGAARTRITRTSRHNPPDEHTDPPRSDRFGLRGQKILLGDLKLRLCSDNSLEITAYDNYRMNVNLDAAMKPEPTSQRLRSGRSNVCVVKPRSSRVRGPKSKRMKYESLSNSIVDSPPDDIFTDSASERFKNSPPVAAATHSDSGSSAEFHYQRQTDLAKENLVPKFHPADSADKIGKNNEFVGRKLRSSKYFTDIEDNYKTSEDTNLKNHVNSRENDKCNGIPNGKQDGGPSCHVSIDLSRIKSLIDSEPNLFVKKTQSFDKLSEFDDEKLSFKFNNYFSCQINGKLKRSCSCDSIFSANHAPAATVGTTAPDFDDMGSAESTGGSQKSRKKKRGRSFKNNGRVR